MTYSDGELDRVNFKSDFIQTFPDTYSNQQYAKCMCEKHLQRLTIPQMNVVFLGLPDYKVLDLTPNKSQKSKQKLVSGFQINFLCIDPDQVNHLKDLRGGIRKIWEFHLPLWISSPSDIDKVSCL